MFSHEESDGLPLPRLFGCEPLTEFCDAASVMAVARRCLADFFWDTSSWSEGERALFVECWGGDEVIADLDERRQKEIDDKLASSSECT
jgi:hypothetical protein